MMLYFSGELFGTQILGFSNREMYKEHSIDTTLPMKQTHLSFCCELRISENFTVETKHFHSKQKSLNTIIPDYSLVQLYVWMLRNKIIL